MTTKHKSRKARVRVIHPFDYWWVDVRVEKSAKHHVWQTAAGPFDNKSHAAFCAKHIRSCIRRAIAEGLNMKNKPPLMLPRVIKKRNRAYMIEILINQFEDVTTANAMLNRIVPVIRRAVNEEGGR